MLPSRFSLLVAGGCIALAALGEPPKANETLPDKKPGTHATGSEASGEKPGGGLGPGGIPQGNAQPKPPGPPPRRAGAKPVGVCNDLAKFTCAPGEWPDGTGTGYSRDKISQRINQMREAEEPTFVAAFKKALEKNDDDTKFFRRRAIAVLGLTGAPPCNDETQTADCNKKLAEALAETSVERTIRSPFQVSLRKLPSRREAAIRDLDLLLENGVYKKVEGELIETTRKKLLDTKTAERVEKEVFPRVRELLGNLLERSIEDKTVRKNLQEKLRGIKFQGTDCGRDDVARPTVHSLVVPNAFYDPIANTFKYCNGSFLQSTSVFALVHTVAHELAHSFDPCHIAWDAEDLAFQYSNPKNPATSLAEFPIKGVLACLRTDESVKAKRSAPARKGKDPLLSKTGGDAPARGAKAKRQEPPKHEGKDDGDRIPAPQVPLPVAEAPGDDVGDDPGDGPMKDRSPFCTRRDQIGEAFADAAASEVLPEYIAKYESKLSQAQIQTGYSNVFRGSCDDDGHQEEGEDPDVHPDTRDRVNRILLPKRLARKQMGCSEEPPPGINDCPFPAAGGAK